MDNSFEKLINRVLDGRYKIENVVGIGGMAYVLKAIDLKQDSRPVAIKILNEEFNGDENAVKRFVNESKAVAMVDSPNIVKIYDIAISDNLKYIVMEFVDGITLKDYIDKVGALGWKEAVHYVRQILRALSHAHEKGIVHRDIKPQNVMLLRDGKVKVTDFGIAKTPTSEPLTMTDKAIGTVNYISPEQASGGKVDEKSDLYSVGVMFYEMLTGKLPFTADSPVAVAMMQVSETPVQPREINPQIPIGLEQIVLKSMSKDPSARFNCASSMEKALEYFVKNPTVIFSGVPSVDEMGKKDEARKEDKSKHRSMFPIILGVTTSFIVVCIAVFFYFTVASGFSLGKILSNKADPADELGNAMDKFLQIEGNNKDDRQIIIKDYVGEQYTEELRDELEDAGFLVVLKDYEVPEEPHGKILKQDPDKGTAKVNPKHGTRVTLTLYVNNNPEETYVIPEIIGISSADAKEMILKRFGGIITEDMIEEVEHFKNVTKGNVFECEPSVGMAIDIQDPPTITLYVSKGPEPEEVIMPEIVGLHKSTAKKALEEAKIQYTEVREYSDEPVNTVVRTSIESGETFMNDTEVVIYISEKNHGESFMMPDCVSDTKEMAVAKISDRFKMSESEIKIVEEYNDEYVSGRVIKTIPEKDTMITDFAATSITLYVSLGKEPENIEMPYVIGESYAKAYAILDNAGFEKITREFVDSELDKNTVVTSNFASGTMVREDREIVLYISNGSLKPEPEPEPIVEPEDEPEEEPEEEKKPEKMDQLLDMAGRPLG